MKHIYLVIFGILCSLSASAQENYFSVTPIKTTAGAKGTTVRFDVKLTKPTFDSNVNNIQYNIVVPEGITITSAATVSATNGGIYPTYKEEVEDEETEDVKEVTKYYHTPELTQMPGEEGYNTYLVTITTTSTADEAIFKEGDGMICRHKFEVSATLADGIYPFYITEGVLANVDVEGYYTPVATSYFTVGNPSNTNVKLEGVVAADVCTALDNETSVSVLDLSKVTGVAGTLTLKDNVDLVPPTTEITVKKVSYARAAANTYGTICLPYVLTSDATVQYYTLGQIADGNLTLVEAATVPAGTPAIWEKKSGSEVSAVATNATIPVVGTHESAGTGIKLVGCYQNTNVTTPGTYYIKDNKFYRINGNFNCGAYRAYIATEQSEAKVLNIVNDDASAINTLNALTSGSYEAIYSEGGAKQDALQKGVNIIKMQDGSVKKVMVK